MSDAEDTGLRFHLVNLLMRVPYGHNQVIDGTKVRQAWKPTGDHDNSFEAGFRALALAAGGNRPETSYTTDERIKNDLDGSFTWRERPENGDYVFHRKDNACPKCRGRMSIRKQEAFRLPTSLALDVGPDAMAFTESWEPCDMHGEAPPT